MVLNFVLGTAAELIKIYPLIRLAKDRGHHVRLIASGQSRENLLMQLDDFGLGTHELHWLVASDGDLEKPLSALKWFLRALFARSAAKAFITDGYVVVHGDTLSTLVGAYHGRRLGLPVAHVEAGLRSPSLFNPFPEEINRRLVSRMAAFHFAPDEAAVSNLKAAGAKGKIVNTGGNTLVDSVRLSDDGPPPLKRYALVNIHRFENLNSSDRWNAIIDAVALAARVVTVVFVMHPPTRHKLDTDPRAREIFKNSGIQVRERMPFSAFIGLLKSADFMITDGGSNQEECSYLGKPCLILREETERREGLDGCCLLSRFSSDKIEGFLIEPERYRRDPVPASASPSRTIMDHLSKPG